MQYAVTFTRVVNLGTTTKLCKRNYVPKPHPGHVVVVAKPKIGSTKAGVIFIFVLFYYYEGIMVKSVNVVPCKYASAFSLAPNLIRKVIFFL